MTRPKTKALDETLAILNGLVGDYLVRTDNGLATDMACYHDGKPLPLTAAGIAVAHASTTGRVAVFVHGVMCTENIWRMPDGSDYGSRLSRDAGFTPFYVRYNTGRAITENGASLAKLLEELVTSYPRAIDELLIVGYSMGGLVLRSACHFATEQKLGWLSHVKRAVYVGTPHLGAPAERIGKVVARVLGAIPDPYTKLIADISNLRSMGVKDLGDAGPVPLLTSVQHYLIAGSLAGEDTSSIGMWFGDAVVPLTSATMRGNSLPEGHIKVFPGLSHIDIPHDAAVYEQIRTWCEPIP
ncbi:MAG TPA: alpha/beta hydrolase [Polyangiales bacterium]|nr:alpha/beta hydrolase [Polyangiales bacterium]